MREVASGTPLISVAAVALDTETTGLDVETARVIQIGAVKIRHGELLLEKNFDQLVDPKIPIPPASSAVHHITDEHVRGAPEFSEAAGRLAEFCGSAIIIGHNIGFDLAVLKHENHRNGLDWLRPRTLDTLLLTRIVNPVLPDFSLDTIASWLGITIEGRHTGLGDALATGRIFVELIPKLRQQGVNTVAEAEGAMRAFPDANTRQAEIGWVAPARADAGTPPIRRALARIDSFPYRHRVRDVMSEPALIAEGRTTVGEAARSLVERGTSSTFVRATDATDNFGIVTERDLMRALAGGPEARQSSVEAIMSHPLITVSEYAFVYRAIARMDRCGIRHLAVIDEDGEIKGAVTTGDLLRQRAQAALIIGDEIDHAKSTAELAAIWASVPEVARSMLDEGIGARNISAVVAEELCALTRRTAQLGEADMLSRGMGEPPAPFCVLVLGSGGRGETLLSPDQDNAIVYDNTQSAEDCDPWFAELGSRIAQTLNDVGVPYCNGGVMAKNKEWRHSLEGWKNIVHGWIARAEPKDLLHVDIFFDHRSVMGPKSLASELWDYAYGQAHRAPGFLRNLAAIATDFRPPFGILGNIITEEGRVELKKGGLMPLVSGARVLAMRHDIRVRATEDRLAGVRELGVVNVEDTNNVIAAHEILLGEVLAQQLEDIEAGIRPSNKVILNRLDSRQRRQLKWALKQIEVSNSMVGDPMAFG